MTEPTLTGIHHVTMIASDAQRNLDFYTGVLGLRLVKLTVNFDAPNGYHLYYGDALGTPGTLLTFFPIPGALRGRQGIGQATVLALAIAPASLGWWVGWLLERGVRYEGPTRRGDESLLALRDPDGLALELVGDPSVTPATPWERSPVPTEHQIRGVSGVTLWHSDAAPTSALLTDTLGFARAPGPPDRERYRTASGSGAIDLRAVGGFWSGEVAAGSIHHVAFRTPDEAQQLAWRDRLAALGTDISEVRDRRYFRSIYVHEPGGVLFEIATAPPGFTIDEVPEELGAQLQLPPWLERQRTLLRQLLPPLRIPGGTTPSAPSGAAS